ncbi:MAG: insulinase family protein [Cocleimonas sp.]|nr:insulinase family protein [Cocleimonas sp.]
MNRIISRSLLLIAVLFFPWIAFAEKEKTPKTKAPISVHEYQLDNGLKVLVKQDKRAPIAVLQLWYRVGTSYEHEGITGLSHALEHLMFKGTTTKASGQFEVILSENGARNNAFTSQDYTAYYEVLAKDRIEVAFELEADRMRNLILDPKEFKKEIEVVKEERRMRTDDRPTSALREQFNAVAFMNSPYRAPVIGWMVDLDTMTLDDLKDWYKKWYAPNNATLVVVGDVDPEHIKALSEKYFAQIPSRKLPVVKRRTEVEQFGERYLQVKRPAKVPSLYMGFKTPSMIDAIKPVKGQQKVEKWEPYALEVLATILDGGSSARLAKHIIRGQEIAVGAGAGYYGYGRLSNLFVLTGTPAKGITVMQLKAALLQEIKALKDQKVTADELKRVKAQVIASEVYERDSIEHIATLLGSLESTGIGYQLMDDYVPQILAVTAEQIQSVANKYLINDHLTVAELIPQTLNKENKDKKKVIKKEPKITMETEQKPTTTTETQATIEKSQEVTKDTDTAPVNKKSAEPKNEIKGETK